MEHSQPIDLMIALAKRNDYTAPKEFGADFVLTLEVLYENWRKTA